jgi:hypothetical protein
VSKELALDHSEEDLKGRTEEKSTYYQVQVRKVKACRNGWIRDARLQQRDSTCAR